MFRDRLRKELKYNDANTNTMCVPTWQKHYRTGLYFQNPSRKIASCGYETNLLLLDMSKAFDTIERSTLIEDLKEILENDELHLIKMLLKDVEYRVRLEGKIGESFLTNIGSPQGDGASALLFIIYLAISLKKYKETRDDSQLPSFLKDHTYQKTDNDDNNNFLTIDQQYAD